MASKRAPKKIPAKIPPKTAERIVAIALQNPELGARRLVPLLKKKRITVSATSVQNILRRRGLQTRAQRLAKNKKKARKPKAPPKKPVTKITDQIAARICEIALQNPELGARRLVPLLQKENIFASTSAVYRILKRNGLQTRRRRLNKAAEISTAPVIFPKKFPDKIPPGVEDRIVEISLQNPDLGARRLMRLLQQEDVFVSASAIYSILKRNGIENRQKRLLKLKEQQITETPPEFEIELSEPVVVPAHLAPMLPEVEIPESVEDQEELLSLPIEDETWEPVLGPVELAPVPDQDEIPEPLPGPAEDEIPEPIFEPAVVAPAEPEPPPAQKTLLKLPRKRSHWIFYPLYLLLFILIGYLGFQAIQTVQFARLEADAVAATDPADTRPAAQTQAAIRPLSEYRVIWQRNLFNVTLSEDSDKQEEISLDKIAIAKKDLGLELVGTVVGNDPQLSRAIIDNRKTREQEAYREGDNAGKVKIKKILRNNVIITTAKGDELLTVEIKESAKGSGLSTSTRTIGSGPSSRQQTPRSTRSMARSRSIKLQRDEVEAYFSDFDALKDEIKVSPYMQGDQPSGFRISNIPADSVLRKMGLRSRDVIVGVDDEDITSPDQAADFFQKLSAGDEVTIRVKRRRRTRQIKLSIE